MTAIARKYLLVVLSVCALFLCACGHTRISTGQYGYFFKMKTDESHSGEGLRRSNLRRVAVLPFWNTAAFAHGSSANLAGTNRIIQESVMKLSSAPSTVKILDPFTSQDIISDNDLTEVYSTVIRDYISTGLIDTRKMRQIMKTMKVDMIVQGVVVEYSGFHAANKFKEESLIDKDELFGKAMFHFYAFASDGTIDWNVRIMIQNKAVDGRRTVEGSNGMQVGLGFLGGFMVAGSLGMTTGGSIAIIESSGLGIGLLVGALFTGLLAIAPLHFAKKDVHKDESQYVFNALNWTEALKRATDAALKMFAKKYLNAS